MEEENTRSRAAREAAEDALIRVVQHYGSKPEFVLLGGLVPELLCSESNHRHAGTTDVDVQVNLEIECGAVNTARLEKALIDAGFVPDSKQVWRWSTGGSKKTLIKFELLADLDGEVAGQTIVFNECENLGAVNLRGTGFASRDIEVKTLHGRADDMPNGVDVNVTGLAGFLLAKTAAAYSRRKPKDWYDLAFVLLHNDHGGPQDAANRVLQKFSGEIQTIKSALDDLLANFASVGAQGPRAYADQMVLDHPEMDSKTLAADAVLAIKQFHGRLFA